MAERKELVIEIGFGDKPFPTLGQRRIRPHEVYIGVDLGYYENFLATARAAVNSLPNKDRIHLIRGNATSLPLPDGCVSEVVLCNVFSTQDTSYIGLQIIGIKRVLKEDGKVVVVETDTPNQIPLPQLQGLFEWHGFEFTAGGIDQTGLMERYAKKLPSDLPDAYAVEFRLEKIDPKKQSLVDEFFSHFNKG